MAQLAEQLTRNEQVAGSNPATSSKKATPDRVLLFLLSLSGVEVYPPSRGKSGHKLPKATPDRVLLFLLSLSGVEVYPLSREKSGHKLPKATPERVLLSCLKRQIDALCTKRLLVIIIAGICTIIMAKYRSKKVHLLPSAAFCRMRSLGVERKCWFSTNCPCICCLFVVFLIASKRFVVCIWGIACR